MLPQAPLGCQDMFGTILDNIDAPVGKFHTMELVGKFATSVGKFDAIAVVGNFAAPVGKFGIMVGNLALTICNFGKRVKSRSIV
jgi:hypothetical protein